MQNPTSKNPGAPLTQEQIDLHWMGRALEIARAAGAVGEIPVGALIVRHATGAEDAEPTEPTGEFICGSGNLKESIRDPLGHAEIRVIREAAIKLSAWRLSGCTLYVTLEPCVMCAGAIVNARVDRVVYAASDAKAGAVQSLYQVLSDARLNHRPQITAGILADESSKLLSDFFRSLRASKK